MDSHVVAPTERLFELWTDIARWPEWVERVEKIVELTGPGDVAGTKYHKIMRMPGGREDQWGEVAEVDRPRLLKIVEHGSLGDRFTGVVRLTPAGTGTDVTVEADYELPWGVLGRIVDILFFRRALMSGQRQSLKRGVALLEAKG
jgi:uncharacterized membrane protein